MRPLISAIAAAVVLIASSAHAQAPLPEPQAPPPSAQAPLPAPLPNGAPPAYPQAELERIVSPIALYPDPLLSEVLAAATYPQDVAEAGEWLRITPERSQGEIDSQPWDASVKAICQFPDVVALLAGNTT